MRSRPNQVYSNKSRAVFGYRRKFGAHQNSIVYAVFRKTVLNTVFRNENNNTVSRNLHLHTGP